MTNQNAQEILEALTNQLSVALDDFKGGSRPGIPIGELPADQAPHIDRVDYPEGAKQVWLRLTNGEAWLLRVYKLGAVIQHEAMVGQDDVLRSWYRYDSLVTQWSHIERTLAAGGMSGEEVNIYFQTWHDEILDDDGRADYDRWISNGYASAEEWEIINRIS